MRNVIFPAPDLNVMSCQHHDITTFDFQTVWYFPTLLSKVNKVHAITALWTDEP